MAPVMLLRYLCWETCADAAYRLTRFMVAGSEMQKEEQGDVSHDIAKTTNEGLVVVFVPSPLFGTLANFVSSEFSQI